MMKSPVLNNTPMQVYTQITKPAELNGDDIWIPCMKTYTVDHDPAKPQGLIITHIESVNHYTHSLKKLLDQRIYAVGSKTYDRLVELGFDENNIHWRHKADELKLMSKNVGPLTWLRGDKYARDFSKMPNVTTIQTYESRPDRDAVKKILKMDPKVIHVYQQSVLEELEVRDWSHTKLRYVQSADPDKSLWLDCEQFDPNV